MSKATQKFKNRMTSLDLIAEVSYLKKRYVGARLENIYDLNAKTYIFKFKQEQERSFLLIESGIRIHSVLNKTEMNKIPSGFAMKLRKHIKSKRLEDIRQIGVERVVLLQFGAKENAFYLICEFYAGGNIVLTDNTYKILQLIRAHTYNEDAKTAMYERYPFEQAASMSLDKFDTTRENIFQLTTDTEFKSKKLRELIAKLLPCCHSAIIDSYLKEEGLSSNAKVSTAEVGLIEKVCSKLRNIYQGVSWTDGFLVKKITEEVKDEATEENKNATKIQKLPLYSDFSPISIPDIPAGWVLEKCESFDKSLELFFESAAQHSNKNEGSHNNVQATAWRKYENIKQDQENRLGKIRKEMDEHFFKAQLIEKNSDEISAICNIINTMINSGMNAIVHSVIKEGKKNGDSLAEMVQEINLEKNTVSLLISDTEFMENKVELVKIDLKLNPYENAKFYYEKRKKMNIKEKKTMEASDQALKVAKTNALKEIKKQENKSSVHVQARKPYWFEKFFWFITSENYLILSGRDAQQNEALVKKYLKKGDIYMHVEIQGGASTIIKNPTGAPIPRVTLEEAATGTICRSKAWDLKIVVGAWWVYDDQVSKTAPSGEFIGTGSFMIRGKKNFIYISRLEMGFGLLFKVDETCVEKHVGERSVKNLDAADSYIEEKKEEIPVENAPNKEEFSILRLNNASASAGKQQQQKNIAGSKNKNPPENKNTTNTNNKNKSSADTKNNANTKNEEMSKSNTGKKKNAPNQNSSKGQEGNSKEKAKQKPTKISKDKKKKIQKMAEMYGDLDEEDKKMLLKLRGSKEINIPQPNSFKKDKLDSKVLKQKELDSQSVSESGSESSTEEQHDSIPHKGNNSNADISKEDVPTDAPSKEDLRPSTQTNEEALNNVSPKEESSSNSESSEIETKSNQESKSEDQELDAAQLYLETNLSRTRSVMSEYPLLKQEDLSKMEINEEEVNNQEFTFKDLTGNPLADDTLITCIPICAPYCTLLNYKYKVKITPGTLKRGKAVKEALSYFFTVNSEIKESERILMKSLGDNELTSVMIGNAKIQAAGLQKLKDQKKKSKKQSSKSKK